MINLAFPRPPRHLLGCSAAALLFMLGMGCASPEPAASRRAPNAASDRPRAPSAAEPPAAERRAPESTSSPEPQLAKSAPETPPSGPPPLANLDPTDNDVVGPPEALSDCEARLERAGAKFRPGRLPLRKQASGNVCGAPQAIIYQGGPSGIKYNGGFTITCQLALGLARFEAILQEEAKRFFDSTVSRINHGGGYSCRKMARFALVSEHSYANAIDVYGFRLTNGRAISVLSHFGALGEPPSTDAAHFLRRVAERAYDENVFSVVLTPFWDKLHANHFHLDQAHYRVDASRASQ